MLFGFTWDQWVLGYQQSMPTTPLVFLKQVFKNTSGYVQAWDLSPEHQIPQKCPVGMASVILASQAEVGSSEQAAAIAILVSSGLIVRPCLKE